MRRAASPDANSLGLPPGPAAQEVGGRLVHREEGFDAQLLKGDVLFAAVMTLPPGPNVTAMNAKAWMSALGALATYARAGRDVLAETATIAAVLAAFCFLSCVIWAGCGTVIGRFLAQPRARNAFNWSMAGLLIASSSRCSSGDGHTVGVR